MIGMPRQAPSWWAHLAATLCVAAAALFAPAAHAGLFDDEEARKAILDLRQRLEQSNEQHRARQAEQMAQLADQLSQLKRSLLDLNSQIEMLRSDTARLRGQNETLVRDMSELQLRQKDTQQGIDERMRRFEPQKVTVDGKEFVAEPEEQRLYEEAMETLRKGDFTASTTALAAFRKKYPSSGYTESVLFWLGNAQYGNRQYAPAIATFRALVNNSPDHPKAPEALLAIANCQAELKDRPAARRTIDELLRLYPKTEAAQAGRDRLAAMR